MNCGFGILYSPWNHTPHWLEWLDRAQGEIGLDHLTLPVVTGAREQFRPAAGEDTHCAGTEGGWHFPPQAKRYAGPAKPRAARGGARGDAVAQLAEAAANLGLKLIFRLELRAVPSLLEHESYLHARNAWGEETASGGACVCNPALRELLRATLEDLMRYQPAGFELQNWELDAPADLRPPRPLHWHPPVRRLLDLCFCSACRDIATLGGVDGEQAARSVRVHVERLISQPPATRPETDPRFQNDPVLQNYLALRRENARLWLERLAEPYGSLRRFLLQEFSPAANPSGSGATGPGRAAAEPESQKWAVLADLSAEAPLPASITELRARLRPLAPRGGLCLRVWRPTFDEPPDLVKLVTEAAADSIGFFDFDGLEEAPAEAVTWVKQAVRFARRGS